MKIISHRGNLTGRLPERENSINYIQKAIDENFDVEIDVWFIDNEYLLGHDYPIFKVNIDFLQNPRLWCHAKNIEAFHEMYTSKIHCFWHESDKITMTSKSIPWCYPGVYLKSGITVEHKPIHIPDVYGICTDYPILFSEMIKSI